MPGGHGTKYEMQSSTIPTNVIWFEFFGFLSLFHSLNRLERIPNGIDHSLPGCQLLNSQIFAVIICTIPFSFFSMHFFCSSFSIPSAFNYVQFLMIIIMPGNEEPVWGRFNWIANMIQTFRNKNRQQNISFNTKVRNVSSFNLLPNWIGCDEFELKERCNSDSFSKSVNVKCKRFARCIFI